MKCSSGRGLVFAKLESGALAMLTVRFAGDEIAAVQGMIGLNERTAEALELALVHARRAHARSTP